MFKDTAAFSGFSVKDPAEALKFYRNTLGINVTENKEMGNILTLHLAGAGDVIAYPKPNHTPATFTVLNFKVKDIENTVKQLKAKGVKFESYDMPGLKTDENNIARGNGPTIAWFTDPFGNILSVIEE